MDNIIAVLNNLKNYFLDIEDKILRRQRKTTIRDIFHIMCISQTTDMSIDSTMSHINLKYKKKLGTKRSYFDRLDKIDPEIFKENISHIFSLINNIKHKNNIKNELKKANNEQVRRLAVDGTYVYMSEKIKIKDDEKIFGKSQNGCCLKVLISAIYDIDNKMPIDYTLGRSNERQLLESQIKRELIKENDMIIHDRGYYSAKLLKEYKDKKINCLFRIKKSNNICKILNKKKISYNTKIIYGKEKIPVRVMYYEIENSKEKGYYLLTNNRDPKITVDDYKEMYRKRWEIETHFLQVKNNTKFVGTNIRTFKNYVKDILINNYMFILSSYIINELTEEYLYWDIKYNKKIVMKIIADDILNIVFSTPKDKKINEDDISSIIDELKKHVVHPRTTTKNSIRIKKSPASKWTTSGSKTGNSQTKKNTNINNPKQINGENKEKNIPQANNGITKNKKIITNDKTKKNNGVNNVHNFVLIFFRTLLKINNIVKSEKIANSNIPKKNYSSKKVDTKHSDNETKNINNINVNC